MGGGFVRAGFFGAGAFIGLFELAIKGAPSLSDEESDEEEEESESESVSSDVSSELSEDELSDDVSLDELVEGERFRFIPLTAFFG